MRRAVDLINQRFGLLVVLERVGSDRAPSGVSRPTWLCQCDCGNTKIVTSPHLKRGHTRSCGCRARLRHGHCQGGKSKIYTTWDAMRNRVDHRIGSRWNRLGMYEPWRDFKTFHAYVIENLGPHPGKGYSIDRIDNDVGYFPGNIRWATASEQQHNRSIPRRG